MNYRLGNRWSPDIVMDEATYSAAAKGGSGAGGTTTVESGGPTGSYWEYTTLGASAQRYVTVSGLNLIVNSSVGLWVNLQNYTDLKKVFIFLGQGGFVNYFRTTITANDLEASNGWVFIQRPKSQFATTGSPDWANPITTIRIGVTAEATATGGEIIQIADFHSYMFSRPKCILFFDDSNDTDLTEAHAYMNPKGFAGVSGTYMDNIGTTNYLSEADLATLNADGWDIVGHAFNELDGLTEAEQITEMTTVKNYLEGLGLTKASDLFVLPGGKFSTDTISAAKSAGITALRTTIQFSYNPAIDPNLYSFHALSTAATTATTATDWLADLDDAIADKATFATFSHGIFTGATGIHTNKAEFQTFIDGLETRVNQGLVDVVTWSEYIDGLSETIWFEPAGSID